VSKHFERWKELAALTSQDLVPHKGKSQEYLKINSERPFSYLATTKSVALITEAKRYD
jgi:hypothetical protein